MGKGGIRRPGGSSYLYLARLDLTRLDYPYLTWGAVLATKMGDLRWYD